MINSFTAYAVSSIQHVIFTLKHATTLNESFMLMARINESFANDSIMLKFRAIQKGDKIS